ncbi:hypothetical protein CK203_040486 [Vitis vinifera]|uniref:RIN4 pathogenic type III effector avirulence factor Avr cleavage site domain-containing protein n=1 Tax=Vitis vinifera TaxID=29760 RepID=A0A438I8C0_VITVI|nr:hypothetical protein CK203_107657 [Vitis vinifera]RVW92907.1 hypothetical protein CK203_040486 [Vitis vinifera]
MTDLYEAICQNPLKFLKYRQLYSIGYSHSHNLILSLSVPTLLSSSHHGEPEGVPQFGGWDQKTGGATNYSMIFSQARANKKQQKADINNSLGNERELTPRRQYPHQQQEESVMRKRKFLTYINCCIRP